MIRWSCTVTPSGVPALTMSLVTAMSAFEGCRVARGVVVHQDQGRRLEFERAFDDLAGVDRRMIDRAALLALMLDQHVLAVEEQNMEFLDLAVRDLRGAVIDQLVP